MSKATLVSLTTICQLKENNEEEMKVGPPHSIMEGDFGQKPIPQVHVASGLPINRFNN